MPRLTEEQRAANRLHMTHLRRELALKMWREVAPASQIEMLDMAISGLNQERKKIAITKPSRVDAAPPRR